MYFQRKLKMDRTDMVIFPIRESSQVTLIPLRNVKMKSVLACWNIYSLFAAFTSMTNAVISLI